MQKKENGKRIFAGRVLALAVVLLLALGLCACGKGKQNTQGGTQAGNGGSSSGQGAEQEGKGFQVIVYSKTKADFIIEDAKVELGSNDSYEVQFDSADGEYGVILEDVEGNRLDCYLFTPSERGDDCEYVYDGNRLTVTVDMAKQGIAFNFYDVPEYRLAHYENGSMNNEDILVFAAADVVTDKGNGTKPASETEEQQTPPEYFTYEDDGSGGWTITGYDGYLTGQEYVYIPKKIDGKPVTTIGTESFSGIEVDEVVIPDSVTTICEKAFWSPSGYGIKKVHIPASVTQIGNYAFADCSRLEEITIEGGNAEIGMYAFSFTDSNRAIDAKGSLTVNVSAKSIDVCAFLGHPTLTSAVIRTDFLGAGAFMNCDKLTDLTVCAEVIRPRAFYRCGSLVNVTIEEGTKEIHWGVFDACTSIPSLVIPESVVHLGTNSIGSGYPGALKTVTILGTLKEVGSEAIVMEGVDIIYQGKHWDYFEFERACVTYDDVKEFGYGWSPLEEAKTPSSDGSY